MSSHRSGRPRRPTLLIAGVALIVAGAAVLGYLGWQLYGTTWVATREQAKVVEATERAWDGAETEQSRELSDGVVALVRIPALGAEYAVPARGGTDDDTLTRGFGVFDSAPPPGGRGNLALAGHRITHGEPLRRMPELRAGDEVVVETATTVYTYVLDTDGDARTVDMDADWVTAADPRDPETGVPLSDAVGSRRLLTLVTCAEIFHTDDRLVAFGHLVSQHPRPAG